MDTIVHAHPARWLLLVTALSGVKTFSAVTWAVTNTRSVFIPHRRVEGLRLSVELPDVICKSNVESGKASSDVASKKTESSPDDL